MDGILNLDKPQGLTSHDVVDRVRKVAGQRKVGHAGTLDPLATGVLPVCLGRATRVVEYLMASPKTYRARIFLGTSTDTYDAEGVIVDERPVNVSCAELENALREFRGPLLQIPPMYSAIKRGGEPLYKLARRGETVERAPRPVEIHRLVLSDWHPPELTIEVDCSPGTYIRSLAHDLGQSLGCGAHLTGLTRLASGGLLLRDATALSELTSETLPSLLLPMDTALQHFVPLHLSREETRAVQSGQMVQAPAPAIDVLARAYSPDGDLVAILEYQLDRTAWQPRKVFSSADR